MKLSVQTLANKKYPVEIEESETVLTLKGKIQELGLGEVDDQKLIHLGKILKNEQTIESANIKANAIIVLMISKIKKAAAAAPAPAADSSASPAAAPAAAAAAAAPVAAAATPAVAAAPATPVVAPVAAAAPATPVAAAAPVAAAGGVPASPAAANAAASALAMGAGLEPMITDLMALGFPRDQVQLALRASFNNPDRAADYLFNGIPDSVLQQQQHRAPPAAQQQQANQQQGGGVAPPPAAGGVAPPAAGGPQANALAQLMAQGGQQGGQGGVDPNNPLAGLASSPQFQQIRAMLQQQPDLIPMLLQQLAQSNPQLAQLIVENPEALADLLAGGGGGGGAPQQGGGGPGPRSHTIQITLEEKQQLDRLEALGFSRQRALEAWVLCDRNEDLAANFLFDNMNQDADDENMQQ